jgi:hypothetical protein
MREENYFHAERVDLALRQIPPLDLCLARSEYEEVLARQAALLPYPPPRGLRPVALRPTFSSGLPFPASATLRRY